MSVIDNLRTQLANLPPDYAMSWAETAAQNRDALKNLLNRQLELLVANQANQIANQANQLANQAQQIHALAGQVGTLSGLVTGFTQQLALYRNRILPVVIGLSVAWTFAQAAMHYFRESGPDAPAGTEETCKKALQECQSGLVRNKDLLDKCKGFIPTLKSQREEAMADWEACLNKLEACENAISGNSNF